jgi:hypothetical protein
VAEALKIDERTGTDFWRKAIEQEMKNVMPAFEFIDGDEAPKFYKKIDCHMIFDVKMDLTRKARLVAGGGIPECFYEEEGLHNCRVVIWGGQGWPTSSYCPGALWS